VASSTTRLMTVAEFEQLPDTDACRYELQHGELVTLAPPKLRHSRVQQTIRDLLQNAAAEAGSTYVELGFRPLPEYEFRYADVAWASRQQWGNQDFNSYFRGVPELVVEVLSPSNTVAEMIEKEKLCLENGGREFWVIDIDHLLVRVSTPDGHTVTYKDGQEIPLLFGGKLAVNAIFSSR
jgi:Uma2 family endonuclease